MRRILFLFLSALSLSIALFFSLGKGGYVLVSLHNIRLELPLVIAVLANLLLLWLIYILISLLRWVCGSRRGLRTWFGRRRQRQEHGRTTRGLIAFIEGRWDYARKELSRAASGAATPLINYLFAARASAALSDERAAADFLKQAALSDGSAGIAIDLTQAELQIDSGQYEQALAILLRAKKKTERHPVVLRLLSNVYWHLQDWRQLLLLLPLLKKTSAMPASQIADLQLRAACGLLCSAAAFNESGERIFSAGIPLVENDSRNVDRESKCAALAICWEDFSSDIKSQLAVVECYVQQLISLRQLPLAERVLRQCLQRDYCPQLVSWYGRVADSGEPEQLVFAEHLLHQHPDDAVLLLALAKISAAHEAEKDKAAGEKTRCYLEQSLSLHRSGEVLLELARFYTARGDTARAVEYYAEATCGDFPPDFALSFPLAPPRPPSALFSSLAALQPLNLK